MTDMVFGVGVEVMLGLMCCEEGRAQNRSDDGCVVTKEGKKDKWAKVDKRC